MILKINKTLKNFRHNIRRGFQKEDHLRDKGCVSRRSFESGQVAVILILVVAMGLIFYAAVLNFSRIALLKTNTTVAANSAASLMASAIASYGESLFQQTMGGQVKICAWTGLLLKIFAFIVVAILSMIAWPVGVSVGTLAYTASVTALSLAIAAAAAAVVMEAAIIQPGITSLWNDMISESLSKENRVIEEGVKTALGTVATDPLKIPDLFDIDLDGVFGDLSDGTDKNSAPDYISRYGYFYTKRLKGIKGVLSTNHIIEDFVSALNDLLYQGTDGWGLYDPLNCSSNPTHPCCGGNPNEVPAFCDKCCQPTIYRYKDAFGIVLTVDNSVGTIYPAGHPLYPAGYTDPGTKWSLRPQCCETGCANPAPAYPYWGGNPATCKNRTPYEDKADNVLTFDQIYDPYYEDSTNSFRSFRELLGVDDENILYRIDPPTPAMPVNPNWEEDVNAKQIPSGAIPWPPEGTVLKFRLEDASGYYNKECCYSGTCAGPENCPDNKAGIFPFFYKVRDWGVSIKLEEFNYNSGSCYLCDELSGVVCNPGVTFGLPADADVLPRLDLPHTAIGAIGAKYSGGLCVDNKNTGSVGDPPQVPDRVRSVQVSTDQNQCATGPNTGEERGWKRGGDRYCAVLDPPAGSPICSQDYCPIAPYSSNCPKTGFDLETTTSLCTEKDADGNNIEVMCYCGQTGAAVPDYWPDDRLDDFVYGITDFIGWAKVLVNMPISTLQANFQDWYQEAAMWIEPTVEHDPFKPGYLYRWRADLEWFYTKINAWITPEPAAKKYIGGACKMMPGSSNDDTAVWCVPPVVPGAATAVPPQKYGIDECPGVNREEQAVFDTVSYDRGDLESVVQCLDWNTDDIPYEHDAMGNKTNEIFVFDTSGNRLVGNVGKFKACEESCTPERCSVLPRSLVPGFDEKKFAQKADPAVITALENCLNVDTVQGCSDDCGGLSEGWVAPNGTVINDIEAMYTYCAANPSDTYACPAAPLTTVSCSDENAKFNCACSYSAAQLGSCDSFCAATPPAGSYKEKIITALKTAWGSCDPDGDWLEDLHWSYLEAMNQQAKFRKRNVFLKGRLAEAKRIRDILFQGRSKLNDFLNGPAVTNLIHAAADDTETEEISSSTEAFAVYVWQDEQKPTGFRGNWHAVKAEVRAPGRCNSGCWTESWPKVITYTKSWGLQRCYELINRSGMVKARVIRYDEISPGQKLTFPDGSPIWQARYEHPLKGGTSLDLLLSSVCVEQKAPELVSATWGWGWDRAFMLNEKPNPGATESEPDEKAYRDCWDYVHNKMLKYGVSSETCAEYFLATGTNRGFRVKFVPCDDF